MNLYSKFDLEKVSKENGFIRDNLEKVFRLADILLFFNTNKLLSDNLVLKGGTAINLVVFDMPRLSVDIDLDLCRECSRDEMLSIRDSINIEILRYMGQEGYVLNNNSKNPHSLDSWAFYYQNSVGNKDNIKIEINYSMRQHVLPLVQTEISVDFLPKITVKALHPIELFGSKIKALIERTASRDLYDVYNMITTNVFAANDLDMLRKSVLFYLAVGGSHAVKLIYSFDAIDKLEFRQIRAQLLPVLKKTDKFNFQAAKDIVKRFLLDLMVFTDDEIQFIKEFNNKRYKPELLFSDDDVLSRIAEHPMAIWKTKNK